MKCMNCGNEVMETDKFCVQCGHQVAHDEVVTTIQSEGSLAHSFEEINTGQSFLDLAKDKAISYWGFILENLKSPAKRGISSEKADYVYGYMNIGLLSLFFGLGIYFQFKSFTDDFGFFTPEISFFESFFTVFFYGSAALILSAAVMFAIVKGLYKANLSFHDVVGRFGSLISTSTALSVVFLLFSVIGIVGISSFVSTLIISIVQIAIILTLYSYRENATTLFDPLYGIIGFYVVFTILIALTSDTLSRYFVGGFIGL
ncbi:zinc ribbon protein [Bacillus oleivorans]|uniref:Zinc ribbon protein n=1 Tax=Bacillus oleivorans TaxID=1448271 RepID=A0A285CUP1_9BACI|nr:zinc ribbon domain-containing protein [Bacillus oleivorans]SNX70653.1 zinc ribbon protein [Bacillus oleivorans]